MTPEEIKAMVADAIKAALPEAVRATVLDAVKPLAEQVATVQKGALTPDAVKALIAEQGKPAAAAGKKGEADPNADLHAALEAVKNELQASKAEAAAEREARATERMRTELTQALTASGIRPEAVSDLVDLLPIKGLVTKNADGSFVFASKDQYGVATTASIADGVAAWAKSDAASIYRPPVQAQGSGQPPGTGRAQPSGKLGLDDFLAQTTY